MVQIRGNLKQDKYDESSIDVIQGLDHIRKKKSMYIGSGGIGQIVKEIIDNSIDEALTGHNNTVGVILENDSIYVFDQGRGIPVGEHPKVKGKSTLEVVFTTIGAGGKLHKNQGGYKFSLGSHAVGSSCTNALSKSFEVWTYRDEWYYLKFINGGKPVGKIKKCSRPVLPFIKDYKQKQGTVVKFIPDQSCFNADEQLDINKLKTSLELSSYLNQKTVFYFITNKEQHKYYQAHGLLTLIKEYLVAKKAEPDSRPFIYQSDNLDVALQWSSYDDPFINSYVNGGPTIEGGTHLIALYRAITDVLKSFKSVRSTYRPEDLRFGLVGIINFKLSSPQFSSQTKEKLLSAEATDVVYESILPELKSYFNSNKALAKRIIQRASEVRSAFQSFKLSKQDAAKLRTVSRGKVLLPTKLVQCGSRRPEERELFIIEGDSAKGTAQKARDPHYQEVLPLKGKPLNVYGDTKGTKTFSNQEILNIYQSIGYNPDLKEPLKNLRYGKIVLTSDADVDGCHIDVLLLASFQKLLPELIEQGKIYTVNSSLYTCLIGTKRYYGESLNDLKKKTGKSSLDNNEVTRIKGWGEISSSLLKEMAFDPLTRKLIQIKPSNGRDLKKFVSLLSPGKSGSSAKRELLGIGGTDDEGEE